MWIVVCVESGVRVESVDGMTYFEDEGLMVVRVSVRHFSVVRVSVRGRISQKNGLWLQEFHRKKSPSGHRSQSKNRSETFLGGRKKRTGFVHHTFVTQL